MHEKFGLVRVTCASIKTAIGNVDANLEEIRKVVRANPDSDILLFSELSLTGYGAQKLFLQDVLLEKVEQSLSEFAKEVENQLVLVGAPIRNGNGLFNCAVAMNAGKICAIQPKQNVCNYNEFYESRWFREPNGSEAGSIYFSEPGAEAGEPIPFGSRQLMQFKNLLFSIAICEDDFLPGNHADTAAAMGALINLNLSSSPEQVSKHQFRVDNIIIGHSALRIAGQAYASSGPTDSTASIVMGGHCGIAENGVLLAESRRVGDGETPERGTYAITADVDVKMLQSQRMVMGTFENHSARVRHEQAALGYVWRKRPIQLNTEGSRVPKTALVRTVDGMPFVPKDKSRLAATCDEIFGVQCCGLAKRLEQLPTPEMHCGISGGLDSTLAGLVGVKTLDLLGHSRTHLHGLTMQGFGTSDRTFQNALDFMRLTGMDLAEAVDSEGVPDIERVSLLTYQQLNRLDGYLVFGEIDPNCNPATNEPYDCASFQQALDNLTDEQIAKGDLTFENVQARHRTELLMSRGFVLGTGDLSELALGWCTYNADHMSMYNPNCSIPKTLVAWLVRHVAMTRFDGELRDVLIDIADTTISPELLPARNGEIGQSTEDSVGPYVLHDFFLYHMVRGMHRPEKILFLAKHADFGERSFSSEFIEQTLDVFYRRFFSQQFKRDAVPNGPKVGTVSLDPRGDWRMPPDADPTHWLQDRKHNRG